MRVIAEIPNSQCRISILTMNQKFIVKIEKGNYEQTYKVSEMDLFFGLEDVKKMVNETFIVKVLERFKQMDQDFSEELSSI
ncbi:hypothetical protein SAMN06265350_102107 [Solitalea koreensis]|uniref:Uncharacterized protein n=2 Tax=Solitalea koreensis TaxID=543615 RepID=A0A521BE34_9SPHI|nr:hypothetical protein SAMN06265350_102107 [Solitalea koreensis]